MGHTPLRKRCCQDFDVSGKFAISAAFSVAQAILNIVAAVARISSPDPLPRPSMEGENGAFLSFLQCLTLSDVGCRADTGSVFRMRPWFSYGACEPAY